jgi:hypothetical protein
MKILKWLLGAAVVLAVLVGGGGLLFPSTSHVERSTVIQRPPAEVFTTLNSFARFNEWSPWFEIDPTAKYTYSGPASGVGARMAWVGNSSGTGTRVSWSLDSEHGYNPINRLFGAFLLDGMVGKDYEKGLAKLKGVLESSTR